MASLIGIITEQILLAALGVRIRKNVGKAERIQ
jgi:hypothetical protein